MMTADIGDIGRLYADGRLILCLEPDLSREAGLVTPLDLARRLASHLREVDPHGDLAELDEQLDAGHDDRALGILRHRLGAEDFIRRARSTLEGTVDEVPEMARLIAGVADGLRAVYTTNLDRLLERAFGGRWWAAAQGHVDLARRSRVIVKLFGTAGRPETWVLTARDHERAYGGHDERREAFEAMYRSHAILFLGFDEGPAILRRLLAAVSPALAGAEPPTHFLATDLARHGHESRRELEERGLRMISTAAVRQLLQDLAIASSESSVNQPVARLTAGLPSPYPGLEPYTRALADFYHGRDEELARAVGMLSGPRRWLSVEGSSGVGKSSFVRAGLVRAFEQGQISSGPQRWRVSIMRPGKRPLLDLATELCRLLEVSGVDSLARSLRDEHGLSGFLREHLPRGEGLVIVVDQLEELLTFSDVEQRQCFADALADALTDDAVPLLLVTTLRSDFVGEFTGQEHGLARMFDTGAEHQILRAMSEAELREVIVQPARTLGVALEHRLPERLLQDAVRMHPGEGVSEAALPLVAHILRGLWDEGGSRGRLTLEAYERLGGISGAVTRSADRVLEGLSKREREQAREVLLMLVNVDAEGRDTRRARTRQELLERAGAAEEGRRLLMHLSGQAAGEAVVRLISLDEGEHARVDLVHEALTHEWATMRGWLAERRKELVGRADLARNVRRWSEQGRPWRGLPGGVELNWMLKVPAENDEQRAYQRSLRFLRGLRVGAAVWGIVGVSLAAVVYRGLNENNKFLYSQSQDRLERATAVAETVALRIDEELRTIPQASQLRRELLDLVKELLADLGEGESNDFVLRAQMVEHHARGDLAMTHDDLEKARAQYEAAFALAKRLLARQPGDVERQRGVGVSLDKLGEVAFASGRLEVARGHLEESLTIDRALAEVDPSNAEYWRDMSVSLNKLGDVALVSGQLEVARGHFEESLAVGRARAEADPSNTECRRSVSVSLNNLGKAAFASGRLEEARGHFEESLAIVWALAEANPSNAEYRTDVSVTLMKLGDVAFASGRPEEARRHFEETLAIRRVLAKADPRNAEYRRRVSAALDRLGDVAFAAGRLEEARGHFEEELAIGRALAAADPSNAEYRRSVSVSLNKLGDVEVESGRLKEARGYFQETLAIRRTLAEADPSSAEYRRDMSVSLERLGDVEVASGRLGEARGHFEETLAIRRELAEADPSNTEYRRDMSVALERLGDAKVASGRLEEARGHFEETLAIRQALAAGDPSNAHLQYDLVSSHFWLSETAARSGNQIESTLHMITTDSILGIMEKNGQIEGYADRTEDRKMVGDAVAIVTHEVRHFIAVADEPSTSAQSHCTLQLTHLPANTNLPCHAYFVCGGAPLYGYPFTSGWTTCNWSIDLQWSDTTTTDGSPAFVFDTRAATFAVWDDPRDGRPAFRMAGHLRPAH